MQASSLLFLLRVITLIHPATGLPCDGTTPLLSCSFFLSLRSSSATGSACVLDSSVLWFASCIRNASGKRRGRRERRERVSLLPGRPREKEPEREEEEGERKGKRKTRKFVNRSFWKETLFRLPSALSTQTNSSFVTTSLVFSLSRQASLFSSCANSPVPSSGSFFLLSEEREREQSDRPLRIT